MTRGFIINLVLTFFATLLLIYIIYNVSQSSEIASFDPFSILGIDHNADKTQIKKAYRAKSLRYHPDKNPDNPSAEAMFMMIAKAYEALTDEESKANWEKYGNPDGKQSLEVSIGLPTFLLDSANRQYVLIFYVVVMVILIPASVWTYHQNSSKYGELGVLYKTWSWLHSSMNSGQVALKFFPEILGGCAEFRDLMPQGDSKGVNEIKDLMKKLKGEMMKPRFQHLGVLKGNLLLHAHLCRESLPDHLQKDLDFILNASPRLVDAMIEVNKQQQNLDTIVKIIEFNQYLTQGMWIKDSTLLQLPHFTDEEVKHSSQGKGANVAKTLNKYREIKDEDKKGMANFTEQQRKDVLTTCELIPNVTATVSAFVDDDVDQKIYESDLITIKVTLDRANLPEGGKAGPVHAPLFPTQKREAWWIILATSQDKIVFCEKVANPDKTFDHEFKLGAPPLESTL